jgi:hypothetical protein
MYYPKVIRKAEVPPVMEGCPDYLLDANSRHSILHSSRIGRKGGAERPKNNDIFQTGLFQIVLGKDSSHQGSFEGSSVHV